MILSFSATMGQTQSTHQYNVLLNTITKMSKNQDLITALKQIDLGRGALDLLPDYFSDLIAVLSILFIVAITIYMRISICHLKSDLLEHKKNCIKSADKHDRLQLVRQYKSHVTVNIFQDVKGSVESHVSI